MLRLASLCSTASPPSKSAFIISFDISLGDQSKSKGVVGGNFESLMYPAQIQIKASGGGNDTGLAIYQALLSGRGTSE